MATGSVDLIRAKVIATKFAADVGALSTNSQQASFRLAGYEPFEWQWKFHAAARLADKPDGPIYIAAGGARGPGKSSAVFAQAGGDDAVRYPGLNILYLRKSQTALKETLAQKLYQILPPGKVGYTYSPHQGVMQYKNGSRIRILYYQSESDIDIHLGQEWDVIVIEEATTLSPIKLEFIPSCLRTTKPGWRPRMYFTFNWGGVGHSVMRRLFYDRAFTEHERPSDYVFFPCTIDDNPKIMEIDPAYVRRLDALTGWMLKSYRYGDPNVMAGSFFTNWNREAVVIPSRSEVPLHWRLFGSLDYGWTHPTAFLWWAIDEEGIRHTVREHVQSKWTVAQHAEFIHSFSETLRIEAIYAGADCFDRKSSEANPIAEEYAANGLKLTRANVNRIQGAAEMIKALGDSTLLSTWKIWDRCVTLISTIPSMQHDPHRPEDMLKIDADHDTGLNGDDTVDSARYFLASTSGQRVRPYGAQLLSSSSGLRLAKIVG